MPDRASLLLRDVDHGITVPLFPFNMPMSFTHLSIISLSIRVSRSQRYVAQAADTCNAKMVPGQTQEQMCEVPSGSFLIRPNPMLPLQSIVSGVL